MTPIPQLHIRDKGDLKEEVYSNDVRDWRSYEDWPKKYKLIFTGSVWLILLFGVIALVVSTVASIIIEVQKI